MYQISKAEETHSFPSVESDTAGGNINPGFFFPLYMWGCSKIFLSYPGMSNMNAAACALQE